MDESPSSASSGCRQSVYFVDELPSKLCVSECRGIQVRQRGSCETPRSLLRLAVVETTQNRSAPKSIREADVLDGD